MKEAKKELQAYFPNRNIADIDEEVKKISQNHWTVINCAATELEEKLKRLPSGRKQIAVSRFEDQVTVVVNELDVLF